MSIFFFSSEIFEIFGRFFTLSYRILLNTNQKHYFSYQATTILGSLEGLDTTGNGFGTIGWICPNNPPAKFFCTYALLKHFIRTFHQAYKLFINFKLCVSVIHIIRDNFPPKFFQVNQKYDKNLLLSPFFCFQCLLFSVTVGWFLNCPWEPSWWKKETIKAQWKNWHDLKRRKTKT